MLKGCLIILSLLIEGALKHHTHDDFKPHRKYYFIWIEIGLGLNEEKNQTIKDCKIMRQNRSKKKSITWSERFYIYIYIDIPPLKSFNARTYRNYESDSEVAVK